MLAAQLGVITFEGHKKGRSRRQVENDTKSIKIGQNEKEENIICNISQNVVREHFDHFATVLF